MSPAPDANAAMASLYEEAKRFLGYRDTLPLGPLHRREFQRFAVATGDINPLYFDEAAAQAAGYPGLLVPPLFLTGVMGWRAGPPEAALREDGLAESDSFLIPIPGLRVMGGGQEVAWHAEVVEGTDVTLHREVEDVRWREGRSGPMVLFTVRRRYVDAAGRLLVSCVETFIGR